MPSVEKGGASPLFSWPRFERADMSFEAPRRDDLMRRSGPRRVGVAIAHGFTLIELMIVVAILGILSAVAIPQYQIYTGKAQLTEALHVSAGLKAAIAEDYAIGRPFSAINGGSGGIPADISSGVGRYVLSLSVAAGTIVAVMKSTQVSPCVGGASVNLEPIEPAQPGEPISWACSTTASCKPATCG